MMSFLLATPTDIKHSFVSACVDAKVEGLVWHDLRATYGTRSGEAGFNADGHG